jgi:hypothetical protein
MPKVRSESEMKAFYGEPAILAIHASGKISADDIWISSIGDFANELGKLPYPIGDYAGKIVGIVQVGGCRLITEDGRVPVTIPVRGAHELIFGDYSVGRYAWFFPKAMMFDVPIYYRGQLGVYNLSDDYEEIVKEQMETGVWA